MTWSPGLSELTFGPTSTTRPAPSWPRIAGNRPSGSLPERVNSSVWQMPVALISTITSPARGPSSWTWVTASGLPGSKATAARTSMVSAPRYLYGARAPSGGEPAQRQHRVETAEGEGVGERGAQRLPARLVGHVVEIAGRIGAEVVDGRRNDAVAQRHDDRNRLERAGGAERVSHHRLRRRDGEPPGVRAERRVQRRGLGRVVGGGTGAVRVDMVDRVRRQ